MAEINFFFEEIEEVELPTDQLTNWLKYAISSETKVLESLNYILCSDDYLHQINLKYLQHDYYTDVITFDNSEDQTTIAGDIYISLDRVQDNANKHSVTLINELRRILVHGLLHLVGYNDKSEQEKLLMTEKENAYLSLPQFKF